MRSQVAVSRGSVCRGSGRRIEVKRLELSLAVIATVMMASLTYAIPTHLHCEYLNNPLGIDVTSPHLSWQSDDAGRNWKQSAYEVLVASREENLQPGNADIWDSGKVDSSDSVGIPYHGPALESRKRYYWKVRVWGAGGQVSESTESAWWETGLLTASDWKAKWIRWNNTEEGSDRNAMRWIWVRGQDPLAVIPKTAATFRLRVAL